jgi:hypothetical protein
MNPVAQGRGRNSLLTCYFLNGDRFQGTASQLRRSLFKPSKIYQIGAPAA